MTQRRWPAIRALPGSEWGTCPICQKVRRLDSRGFVTRHRAWDARTRRMRACTGQGERALPLASFDVNQEGT